MKPQLTDSATHSDPLSAPHSAALSGRYKIRLDEIREERSTTDNVVPSTDAGARGAVEGPAARTADAPRPWARTWLENVSQAARAIEHHRAAAAARREAAMSLGSPMASGPRGKGGAADPMAAVDAMVDAEADGGPAWAYAELDAFYRAMGEVRAGCEGEIAEGTWAAELRYALGMTAAAAARELGWSKATLYRRLDALADYLDFIGPGIARAGNSEN